MAVSILIRINFVLMKSSYNYVSRWKRWLLISSCFCYTLFFISSKTLWILIDGAGLFYSFITKCNYKVETHKSFFFFFLYVTFSFRRVWLPFQFCLVKGLLIVFMEVVATTHFYRWDKLESFKSKTSDINIA